MSPSCPAPLRLSLPRSAPVPRGPGVPPSPSARMGPDLQQQPCLHCLLAGDEVGLHEQDVLAQLLQGYRMGCERDGNGMGIGPRQGKGSDRGRMGTGMG